MVTTAKLKQLRIAPRKVRLVANLIRGKTVQEARAVLNFTVKGAAAPILKLLDSAVSNAKHNQALDEANQYISKIVVDEGRKQKHLRPRAKGASSPITKRSSQITLVLGEVKKEVVKKAVKRLKAKMKAVEARPLKPVRRAAVPKPKFKTDFYTKRPKIERGLKRVFRRKAF